MGSHGKPPPKDNPTPNGPPGNGDGVFPGVGGNGNGNHRKDDDKNKGGGGKK